ncbi:MAG TPA: hypothetical protein VGJ30_00135 [Candidatus Angelobacter sp.]|jgi:hypothetical protein
MKKYIVPTIILILIAVGIFIRYEIVAPARAAARDLEAINGITVGKTTEAELLGRSAFQKMDRRCFQAECGYHTERMNTFLSSLGLAPRTFFGTVVMVRDGLVTQVSVFMTNGTRPPFSLSQKMQLPAGCASSPCVKPAIPPTKVLASIMVVFNNESEFRNRMPEAAQTACLSRLHGCTTYDELAPLARGLNLDAIAALK